MAIRRQVQYDSHTNNDKLCTSREGIDVTSVASEALVFMVVGPQFLWKMPVASFFIKTLTQDSEKILLHRAPEELRDQVIKVPCMTMDS